MIDNQSSWSNFERPLEIQQGSGDFCRGHKSPNIVYLLVDDLGYGDVGYNEGKALTPNLNEMANGSHSIHFTRFYAGGPTCSPTRATLLTGRNHNRYCIWHADLGSPIQDLTCPSLVPLPPSEVTVAELLKEAGYHKSIYGKWHIGDLKPVKGGNVKWPVSHPGMHGFIDWLVMERHVSTLLPNCKCSLDYPCKFQGRRYDPAYCRNYWRLNPNTGKLEKYPFLVRDDSRFLVDQLENVLNERDPSTPFFTVLAFHAVHDPYPAKPHWRDYYKKSGLSRRHADYLGTISGLDEEIGRVRELLKKHGVYNNTMLWFSSDNGPQKGEPGSTGGLKGRKGNIWEGGIRVPGIIEWPAVINDNRVLSTPVVTNDFLPTVADIVGLEVPENVTLDGISLLPLLQGRTEERGANIKFAFHVHKGSLKSSFQGAVVGDQYKYLAQYDRGEIKSFYLFDINLESNEETNVSMAHPHLTNSMREELDTFLQSVKSSATYSGCLEYHDHRNSAKCRV